MKKEVITCDRCGEETRYPKILEIEAVSMERDLCDACVEDLRLFLRGAPQRVQTVEVFTERDIEAVYRKGGEAIEAWANGATADKLAEMIRDMLSNAKREVETAPKTLLGVPIAH